MSLVLLFAMPGLAALVLWLARPSARVSRRVSLMVGAVIGLAALWLVSETGSGSVLVHVFGGWRPPFGIAFALCDGERLTGDHSAPRI